MQRKNILEQFQQLLNLSEDGFQILEHQVPVETQMEYFKFNNRLSRKMPAVEDIDIENLSAGLYDTASSTDAIKKTLSTLALTRNPKAYRILEQYAQTAGKELTDWAHMALMEIRMALETELSDERHIYISTGLGGKGNKLRFYILLLSAAGNPFLDYQRQVIEREFTYLFLQEDGEIEQLNIRDNYVEVVTLAPIQADINRMIANVIRECNQYGDFLSNIVTLTNVKRLTQREIAEIIQKHENSRTST